MNRHLLVYLHGATLPQEAIMARYYFHILGAGNIEDTDGEDFATLEDAKAHAEQIARELSRDSNTYHRYELCVSDEKGVEVARVPISK